MRLKVQDFSLILLIGASGAGKSTFARKHFLPTEVISSDVCRGLVSDDENSMAASQDAFELLHYMVSKRLANRRLTVVDATNVQADARRPLIELARQHHSFTLAIVFELPDRLCHERNQARLHRNFGPHVVRRHNRDLKRSLRRLRKEGVRSVYRLRSEAEVDAAVIDRQPLWSDRRGEHGPYDVIGDIHGCFDELVLLLKKLGWQLEEEEGVVTGAVPPVGRQAIFLGDLVDRGPRSPDVLKLVMSLVDAGHAICVPGNHDVKLLRWLNGKQVQARHGLEQTIAQFEPTDDAFRERVREFLTGLVNHAWLDDGNLVVAHAGLRQDMHGRSSGAVRSFALFGETSGETDEFGLPVRHNWAADYRGRATVLYGHTPVPEARWLNNTLCLDTGCVFGGKLSALRYPERELVEVAAAEVYSEPVRPLEDTKRTADDTLDIADIMGRMNVETSLHGFVTVPTGQSAAALETMSRFAVDPRWLIYLPPTMAPCATSKEDGYLEHPKQAIDGFSGHIRELVCQEKHMGSRAVIVLCRDADTARETFGVDPERDGLGCCTTRTGRRFFGDSAVEFDFLDRLRQAASEAKLWQRLNTGWLCLDAELMPWSAKARELLQRQYAPIGAAGSNSLTAAHRLLERAAERGVKGTRELTDLHLEKRQTLEHYTEAWARYCWSTEGLAGLKLAPFHLLASEGEVHSVKDHLWHMQEIERLYAADSELLQMTRHLTVSLDDEMSRQQAIDWWLELTAAGGEGMVVKPRDFTVRGTKGLVQPAVKCRGREYLRIIYGPEYTLDANLERLRRRGLGRKRSLALREFALGIEALERFVSGRGLRAVHECVFAVLALEAEAIDPRL